MAKAEFCQLAHKFDPQKYSIGGWFLSEKLDGMRCLWDGGVTRGMPKSSVPWANNSKDQRYTTPPVATGLWSRYGNVIHAPDYWLNSLPLIPLDGELYCGRESRQLLISTVKDLEPGPGWQMVQYCVFDMLPVAEWLKDRIINTTNFKKTLIGCVEWFESHAELDYSIDENVTYQTTVKLMEKHIEENEYVKVNSQNQLPYQTSEAESLCIRALETISSEGGEGLVVRSNAARYVCERSHQVQKIKKLDDDEGIVVGCITGRETDLGSKLLGKMGALILNYKGKRLELSGFTDDERELSDPEWAIQHPGEECPDYIEAINFPRGTTVTFKYRGLSNDGIPQEARYWRIH